jgi:hypothetical protein
VADGGEHGVGGVAFAAFEVVPTANPKRLTVVSESVDSRGDGRSLQVDLVRGGRIAPVAGLVAGRNPCPSAPAQCATAQGAEKGRPPQR